MRRTHFGEWDRADSIEGLFAAVVQDVEIPAPPSQGIALDVTPARPTAAILRGTAASNEVTDRQAWIICLTPVAVTALAIISWKVYTSLHGPEPAQVGVRSAPSSNGGSSSRPDASGVGVTNADQAVNQVMSKIMATPQGRAEVERVANQDDELTRFQHENGISDRIAEAAIKEWFMTHNKNPFRDYWNLEDVKRICLRNKREGIPYQYLPEREK